MLASPFGRYAPMRSVAGAFLLHCAPLSRVHTQSDRLYPTHAHVLPPLWAAAPYTAVAFSYQPHPTVNCMRTTRMTYKRVASWGGTVAFPMGPQPSATGIPSLATRLGGPSREFHTPITAARNAAAEAAGAAACRVDPRLVKPAEKGDKQQVQGATSTFVKGADGTT